MSAADQERANIEEKEGFKTPEKQIMRGVAECPSPPRRSGPKLPYDPARAKRKLFD